MTSHRSLLLNLLYSSYIIIQHSCISHLTVIVNSTFLKRQLETQPRAPTYSRALVLCVLIARLLGGLQSYEISIPSLVDRVGDFISYDVTHRRFLMRRRHRRKRSGTAAEAGSKGGTDEDPWLFYRVSAFGREFRLNVSRNRALLAPSFVVEVWNEKGEVEERRRGGLRTDCLYTGHIVDEEATSRVALSNCDGLVSYHALFTIL